MKLIVILSSVIAALIGVLGCISASWMETLKSNKNLKNELKKSSSLLDGLSNYMIRVTDAIKERNKVENEIKGAKNEKELMDIANSIIDNNNKLSNDKSKASASTKTTKGKSKKD